MHFRTWWRLKTDLVVFLNGKSRNKWEGKESRRGLLTVEHLKKEGMDGKAKEQGNKWRIERLWRIRVSF